MSHRCAIKRQKRGLQLVSLVISLFAFSQKFGLKLNKRHTSLSQLIDCFYLREDVEKFLNICRLWQILQECLIDPIWCTNFITSPITLYALDEVYSSDLLACTVFKNAPAERKLLDQECVTWGSRKRRLLTHWSKWWYHNFMYCVCLLLMCRK